VKSVLPPTGIGDVAAAGVAVTVTCSSLLTVNSLLAAGAELENEEELRRRFREVGGQVKDGIASASGSELLRERFWKKLIHDAMYA